MAKEMKMSEGEVLYTEVEFTRGARGVRACTNGTTSSSAETTYSEVRTLRTEPPSELPGAQQAAVPNEQSKVTWQTVALLVLSALLAAAVIALCVTLNMNIQTVEHLRKLQYDHDAVKKNLSETRCEPTPCSTVQPTCPTPTQVKINQPCQKCEEGWEQDRGQCYFFSINGSSWEESRNGCKRLGGDLVKIDSREEKSFLSNRLIEKMDNTEDKFWIGLTDSEVEGEWLWVDGSRLNTRFDCCENIFVHFQFKVSSFY
ncbi:CD209 antigen-like protein E [Seriola dumerili]|uniref:CD209 antigen-like protein E n=1 Tax=Seriola dumerili TaxID=41447 RepID=UPI000BBE8604|nr:CD209 antigen-like protein E [Seriola dumerili]